MEFLDHHIKAEKSHIESDWISGIEVAADFINRFASGSCAVKDKHIILFSDLGCPSKTEEKFDTLLEEIRNKGIELSYL